MKTTRIHKSKSIPHKLKSLYNIWFKERHNNLRNRYPIIKYLEEFLKSFSKLRLSSAALTYHTIFAIVPVFSLMTAIANGFGYGDILKQQLSFFLQGQELVTNKISELIDNYLSSEYFNTNITIFIGLVILFYSVYSIIETIDEIFNEQWEQEGRSMLKLISKFVYIVTLPLISIIALSLWWFISSYINGQVIKSISIFTVTIIMYTTILFIMYKTIPRAKVRFKPAFISAVICGMVFGVMQYLGYYFASYFNNYKNIYGDLVNLMIFLIWLYLSWTICLAGAKWSYILQKGDEDKTKKKYEGISLKYYKFLCILLIERLESLDPFYKGIDENQTVNSMTDTYNIPLGVSKGIIKDLINRRVIKKCNNRLILNYGFRKRNIGEVLENLEKRGTEYRLLGNDKSDNDIIGYNNSYKKNNVQKLWENFSAISYTYVSDTPNSNTYDIENEIMTCKVRNINSLI